ncbi:hypothetical protein ABEV05_05155 [Acinetobacter baumannii]|uniref:hypothetical protein n=1 Tax=Acinetobacter baumannii TaxID=470 RepID=UPI002224333D|nr:hypothetical protein [Acinetobacter baumannii]MCW1878201.1 hypothetical protein [Acinetobacter baumannii]
MKIISIGLVLLLTGCVTLNNGPMNKIQIISSNSELINGCKKLGPIHVDIQSLTFNRVAHDELIKQASNYGADSIAIIDRQNLALGHVIIDATALKCYS